MTTAITDFVNQLQLRGSIYIPLHGITKNLINPQKLTVNVIHFYFRKKCVIINYFIIIKTN